MSKQTSEKENATSNTSNKSKETPNKDSNLIERQIIENTPFYVVRQKMDNGKDKYFMIMGDYRLTEPTDTEKETLEKLVTEHWLIIANIVALTVDKSMQMWMEQQRQADKATEKPYDTESL